MRPIADGAWDSKRGMPARFTWTMPIHAAASYAVINARVGYLWRVARWSVESFARIDNLTDRRYAGSVIVNQGNGRFFEPAQGRAYLFGVTATINIE